MIPPDRSASATAVAPRLVHLVERYHELGDLADAFASFFFLDDRLYSVHRRFNLNLPDTALEKSTYTSEIVLSDYERAGDVFRRRSERLLCLGEDPRVVSDGRHAYIVCRGGLHEAPDGGEFCKLVVLPEKREVPIRLPDGLATGKNWQPFLKDGKLFVIHGFAPLTIMEIDKTGRAEICHRRQTELWLPASHDGYTMLRGGSNGLTIGDNVVGLGHITIKPNDHRPFLWLLDRSSTVRVVLPVDFIGLREKGFNIVDPTSLALFDGKLFLGLTASEREWFYGQRFLNILVEIPLSGRDLMDSLENGSFFAELGEVDLSALRTTRTFPPSELPRHDAAESSPNGVRCQGTEGCLLYGPYERVECAGTFVAELTYSRAAADTGMSDPATVPKSRFEVCFHKDGETTAVASCHLLDTEGRPGKVNLPFETGAHIGWLLETRVFAGKDDAISVFNIRVFEA